MSEEAEADGAVPDLRLRGDPPQVMRLSRKALAILGLVGGTAIGGALLYALQPAHKQAPEELYSAENHATPDTLAGAPKDYSQVPKLGPPLPGDLGRPIVAAQGRGVDVAVPSIGATPPSRAPGGVNAADAARQRAGQERDSARTSKLFLASTAGSASQASAVEPGQTGAGRAMAASTTAPAASAAAGTGDDDQARKRAFLAADPQRNTVSAERLVSPPSPYTLLAGSIIQAAMITGVRSDLPGQVTAQVAANVYDSATGHLLLIPQGSKLIGEYDSQISFGQNRVLLAWNRLILPDGRSLVLEREPGADTRGFAGLQDGVNYHWGGIGKAALLSTLLGVGAELGASGDDALLRAVRQGTSDTINQAGQQIVRRQLSVQPTLTIRPGYPVRVIVTHDLVLAPAQAGV
ncbi:TrbI/VirB10 family protein [Sphingomonas sp. RT2P30]|uniref:TrbI/VirB10 family protein n=1 Tax=Parasphingomonas halimpatiens TaxID=3096162 RepID=UPI002FCB5E18